jgi:hypothetical protein
LWIVLTDADEQGMVAVVNLTTHGVSPVCQRGDCLVVLPGEHPFVRKESCLFWRQATLAVAAQLDRARERRLQRAWEPLEAGLLRRVQEAVANSPLVADRVQRAVRRYLESQGT